MIPEMGDAPSAVMVDSNVLLDVLTQDEQWGAWSASAPPLVRL
jgi:hypothetical protein